MMPPPPPPPPRKRKAPPPPPRARNLELERIRYEDSFIAPFIAGEFAAIPADVLPVLYEACKSAAESKTVSAGAGLTHAELFGAIFSFTDYPSCSLSDGARQLREIIKNKTPFCVLDSRAIRWLAAETESNPPRSEIE